MNVFDTLFPARARTQPRKGAGESRHTRARGGQPLRRWTLGSETLEGREMLAITDTDIVRTSAPDFFIDTSRPQTEQMLCNYVSFQITNAVDADPLTGAIDVWVKATNFGSPNKIALADDGLMHVGMIDEGATGAAFFYLQSTAGEVIGLDQNYDIEVYDANPTLNSLLAPIARQMFTFANVYETAQTNTNKISAVTYDNTSPVVGDDITMYVDGELGNNAELASFSPATRLGWLANTFELYKTEVRIDIDPPSSVVNATNQLYFTGLDGKGSTSGQVFKAAYTFRITGSTNGPIYPSPTQFTLQDQNWKHHGPEGGVLDVPQVTSKLTIQKTPDQETVIAGDPLSYTYTITVKNNSTRYGADEVLVTDAWPGGLTQGMITPSQGTYSSSGGDFSWNVGSIAAGGIATLTVAYTVPSSALPSSPTQQYINKATVTSPSDTESPHSDIAETTVVTSASLKVVKDDGLVTVVAGDPTVRTYTITVTNNGLSDAQGVVVTDTWPAAFQQGSVTPLQGSVVPGPGSNFTWTIPTIVKGATATLTATYTVPSGAVAGPVVNRVDVTSSTPNPGDTQASDTTTVVVSALSISKSGSALYVPGSTLTYTVIVSNLQGPSDATNVQVLDALPPEILSWSWAVTFGGGATIYNGFPESGTGAIDTRINLPVGGTATFAITNAKTSLTATTDILNTATAIPSNGGKTVQAQWVTSLPIIPTAGAPALVVGSDDGCNGPPIVTVLDAQADIIATFLAYDASFRSGVRVFSADVTGDGVAEIIVAPSRNAIGEIRVFSRIPVASLNYTLLPEYTFYPFGKSYRGGVEVAAGDFNGDGINDILCGQSTGAGLVSGFVVTPPPSIPGPLGYKAVSSTPYFSFRGFPSPYAGGVMVGAGDLGTYVNGVKTSSEPDGRSEVVVGSNAGMRATVKVFSVSGAPNVKPTLSLVKTLNPFGSTFRGGVTLSVSPTTQLLSPNLPSDLYVGAGVGGKSLVEAYNGNTWMKSTITAFSSFAKPNARVFAAPIDLLRNGVVDNVFGVQGLGGAGGTNGVTPTSTGIPRAITLKPALRIAPIVDSLLLLRRR